MRIKFRTDWRADQIAEVLDRVCLGVSIQPDLTGEHCVNLIVQHLDQLFDYEFEIDRDELVKDLLNGKWVPASSMNTYSFLVKVVYAPDIDREKLGALLYIPSISTQEIE